MDSRYSAKLDRAVVEFSDGRAAGGEIVGAAVRRAEPLRLAAVARREVGIAPGARRHPRLPQSGPGARILP